jgi:hypothetical protein
LLPAERRAAALAKPLLLLAGLVGSAALLVLRSMAGATGALLPPPDLLR